MRKQCGCEIDEAGSVVRPCENQDKSVAVARRPCGCCVAAYVTPEPEASAGQVQDYARELRAWERQGLTREMRTVGWVRHTDAAEGGLQFACPHRPARKRKVA